MASELKIPLDIPDVEVLNTEMTADGRLIITVESQVETTLDKHFADQSDLVLVTVQAQRLGSQLKWERSREDELFPHLYAELPLSLCKLIATRKDASTGWQPEHA